jgi:hypothetical protein
MFSELNVSSLFVQARQAAISSHVCRQDRCQPSRELFCGQGCAPRCSSVYASGLGCQERLRGQTDGELLSRSLQKGSLSATAPAAALCLNRRALERISKGWSYFT